MTSVAIWLESSEISHQLPRSPTATMTKALVAPVAVPAPPGLKTSDSGAFSAKVAAFEPGGPGVPALPASPVDEATYRYMYTQLLFQYNAEVPSLRHRALELSRASWRSSRASWRSSRASWRSSRASWRSSTSGRFRFRL